MKSISLLSFAALLVAFSSIAGPLLYVSAELRSDGSLMITTSDGAVHAAPQDVGHSRDEENQVGFAKAMISEDKTIIGWLSLYHNCCTSYPIPQELVLQSNGIVVRSRGNGLPIWEWGFRDNATQVALRQSPTHGSTPDHYELRDITTGQLVDQFDPEEQGSLKGAPRWAFGLE